MYCVVKLQRHGYCTGLFAVGTPPPPPSLWNGITQVGISMHVSLLL